MVRALAVVAALASCSPYGGGAFTCAMDSQCGAGGKCENSFCAFSDDKCPSGLRYGDLSGPNSNVCVGQEPTPDASMGSDADASMTGSDSGTSNVCYGTGPGKVCFAQAPTGTQLLNTAIDTDGAVCATNVVGNNPGCVIAGDSIVITGAVAVTGSKPLVLVAATTISMSTATLDASSHRAGGGQIGAGADPNTCDAGTAPGVHGGGAGGSFGGTGGAGGNDNVGMHGGTAGAAMATLTALHGGCPGQAGNAAGGTAGGAGHGGGAVYLVAGTSITITSGSINASGQPGTGGATQGAGGGGGGAGGLVAFDAPTVTNNGSVFANGGGGAEGAGANSTGNTGADPTAVAAPGGAGATTAGGDGGAGAFAATANGTAGAQAGTSAGNVSGGGGGGGGGAGLIKIYQATMIGGSGTESPPPG